MEPGSHLIDAMATARSLSDGAAELSVRLELGRVDRERGDLGRVVRPLRRSLALAGRLGDRDIAANLRLFFAESAPRRRFARRGGGRRRPPPPPPPHPPHPPPTPPPPPPPAGRGPRRR
ncbi:hypothetical protein, partial [Saccharopolyspora sp. 6M]|uniref:hypothetical protein n=1 Tax=Saccharopolyspora sp. 6M TaxID=2877237 RepID=UPI001CD468F6